MAHLAGTSAQRIRYGLTGLAIAFLIVLLGSVISRASRDDPQSVANAQVNADDPNEPLAQLGVAPGGEASTNNVSEK